MACQATFGEGTPEFVLLGTSSAALESKRCFMFGESRRFSRQSRSIEGATIRERMLRRSQ